MKKFKEFFKRHLKKILCLTLVVAISIYACVFAFKSMGEFEIFGKTETETKIYVVWHVETFEGGGKARVNYLKAVARELESENDGVLFMIKTIEADKLADELLYDTPDIISFGYGVGDTVLPYLTPLNSTYNLRDEMVASGMFNNSLYALAYISSGYALFSHGSTSTELHVGSTGYTDASSIVAELNQTANEDESQYEAYKAFVYNKNCLLLGTGRDVFRVTNLNNLGRLNAGITPVDSYSDLIQYLALVTSDDITNTFLSLALSDEFQHTLSTYSLFSTKYIKLYSTGIYKDMEDAILNCKIAHVFS